MLSGQSSCSDKRKLYAYLYEEVYEGPEGLTPVSTCSGIGDQTTCNNNDSCGWFNGSCDNRWPRSIALNPYYDERVTFLKEFNGSSTFDLTISNYQSIVKNHDTWFNDRQRNERKVGVLENLKVRSFVIYSVTLTSWRRFWKVMKLLLN